MTTTEPDSKPVTIEGEASKQEQPKAGQAKEPKTAAKSSAKPSPKAAEKSAGGAGKFFIILLLLILIGLVAAGGYFGWQYWQQDQLFKQTYSQTISQQQQLMQQLDSTVSEAKAQTEQAISGENTQTAELKDSVTAIEQRLDRQNKRIASLSSTSREDWLLAEAEYLLRLANQRLLTERSTKGSIGLLEAADKILRDFDDVDLFSIRKAIGRDLASLKISAKVDRDGLFLRLSGLATQIEQLPTVPKRVPLAARNVELETPVVPENVGWWNHVEGWGESVLKYLGHLIEFRRNEPVNAMLPPEAQSYVKLNLRFMLERAELAMLREEKVIYETSLQQARHWLQTQFPPSSQIAAFITEINELEQQQIVAPLPDISSSLEQLRAYIERLHKIKSSQPKLVVKEA